MTVGIIKSTSDSLRMRIENSFVKAAEGLNYHAVSALSEFGPKGLTGLDQTDTYIKVCNNRIDAVITVALIDGIKEEYQKPGNLFAYPAGYYYNRIWNYKNIEADLTTGDYNKDNSYFWEIIVYNLNTLEAECTMQTRSYTDITDGNVIDELAKEVIRKMQKEKILIRREKHIKTAKPF
jgi:hypothetical protein